MGRRELPAEFAAWVEKRKQEFTQAHYEELIEMVEGIARAVGGHMLGESVRYKDGKLYDRHPVEFTLLDAVRYLSSAAAAEADYADEMFHKMKLREQQLGNLLAVIHRDGGHYLAEHGWEKAVNDAARLSAQRLPPLLPD